MENFISICRKVYNRFRGRDVIAVQSDIIDSLQEERRKWMAQVSKEHREVEILQSRVNELSGIRVGLQKELNEAMNKPAVVIYESKFVMTQKVYDDLEYSLEPAVVTNNTTAQGAGYLVGIQRALAEVRKRYVTNN